MNLSTGSLTTKYEKVGGKKLHLRPLSWLKLMFFSGSFCLNVHCILCCKSWCFTNPCQTCKSVFHRMKYQKKMIHSLSTLPHHRRRPKEVLILLCIYKKYLITVPFPSFAPRTDKEGVSRPFPFPCGGKSCCEVVMVIGACLSHDFPNSMIFGVKVTEIL